MGVVAGGGRQADGAHPSPFYIIITHQKPTMEIADALYGVSMQGDGITQVISQRLQRPVSEPEPVSA